MVVNYLLPRKSSEFFDAWGDFDVKTIRIRLVTKTVKDAYQEIILLEFVGFEIALNFQVD